MSAVPEEILKQSISDIDDAIRQEGECAGIVNADVLVRVIRGMRSVILEIVDMGGCLQPRPVRRVFLSAEIAEQLADNIKDSAQHLAQKKS